MRIRLADYVANFLVEHGVTDVFSVVGGGAMHLNDALGHNEKLCNINVVLWNSNINKYRYYRRYRNKQLLPTTSYDNG